MKKFMRKYGASIILLAIIVMSMSAGFILGRLTRKKQPQIEEVDISAEEVENNFSFSDKINKEQKIKKVIVTATAYCSCEKCCGKWGKNRPKDENGKDIVYTASGTIAKQGRTIAVDPSVIPYGTKVMIEGQEYIAEDCGSAIKGSRRIDVYFESHEEALKFGKKQLDVFIFEE